MRAAEQLCECVVDKHMYKCYIVDRSTVMVVRVDRGNQCLRLLQWRSFCCMMLCHQVVRSGHQRPSNGMPSLLPGEPCSKHKVTVIRWYSFMNLLFNANVDYIVVRSIWVKTKVLKLIVKAGAECLSSLTLIWVYFVHLVHWCQLNLTLIYVGF